MISGIYLIIFAVMNVYLVFRIIKIRRAERIAIGDGGLQTLNQAIRAHGNFIEFVPLVMVMILAAEFGGAPAWSLHLAALTLLAGRISHAYSFLQVPFGEEVGHRRHLQFRTKGMLATFISIAFAILAILLSF